MKLAIAFLSMTAVAAAQVDQSKVDQAVKKGIEFLKTAKTPGVGFAKIDDTYPIVLLTMVHAGVPHTDPKFQELLKRLLEDPIDRTYQAVLTAMILEEIHRVKYQMRIAQCAQHLIDNQCKNGQWSYGEPTVYAQDVPIRDVATSPPPKRSGPREFGAPGKAEKPKVVRQIPVKKQKDGPAKGDNSNSQYAALGLRACADAGILLPKDVLQQARAWWLESQHPAGEKGGVATSGGAIPRGWCYSRTDVCAKQHNPYGAMTAGAVGAMAIYDHLLEIDWKKDAGVRSGLAWLEAVWTVTENPGPVEFAQGPKVELYYYLYALERLGMLLDIRTVGKNEWYEQGAHAILAAQKDTGAWDDGATRGNSTWDTCFAILFLKKATKRLDVVTGDK